MKGMEKQGVDQSSMERQKKWIYWGELFQTKFQASCLAKRMEEDWWIYGYDSPSQVQIFRTKNGQYGVRYVW